MYNRILIPIENLETLHPLVNELNTLQVKENHSVVTLLHVLIPPNNADIAIGYVADVGDIKESLEREGRQLLGQAEEHLQTQGIRAMTVLKWGEPAQEICRYAEGNQTDLIIVGNKNKNLLEKLLVGSVSQRVVQHAPSHVLVVK